MKPLFEEEPSRNHFWIYRYLSSDWIRPLLVIALCTSAAAFVSILRADYFAELGRTEFSLALILLWLLAFIFIPSCNRFFFAPAIEEFATKIDADGYSLGRFFSICFEALGYIVLIFSLIQIILAGAGIIEIPGT